MMAGRIQQVLIRRMFGSQAGGSVPRRGLEEFVDRSERDSEGQVKAVGRSWNASELRLKSYEDLHSLWFVLLKERNMLHTEKYIAKRNARPMELPERFQNVRKSMARLKTVLSERSIEHKTMIAKVKAERGIVDEVKKKEDWICSNCGYLNFRSRTQCRTCQAPKPLDSVV